jgi:hypothetical protein
VIVVDAGVLIAHLARTAHFTSWRSSDCSPPPVSRSAPAR